jgi:hypothetical protein
MTVTEQLGFGDRFALGRANSTGAHRVRLQYRIGAIGAFFNEISVAHTNLPGWDSATNDASDCRKSSRSRDFDTHCRRAQDLYRYTPNQVNSSS